MDIRAMINAQMSITEQIRKIHQRKDISQKEKANLVGNLDGLGRRKMMVILNQEYRTGPGLDPSLASLISVGRPRGAPKGSAMGKKKDD